MSLTTPEPRPFVAWSKRSTSATGSQGEDRDPDLLPSEQSASTFRIGSFNVRRNLVIAVVVAVLFVGVGLISESSLFSGTSTSRVSGGTQTDRYVAEYGGVESVYRGILNTADCTSLQASFDRAADNNDRAEPGSPAHRYTLGYMTAADDRMEQIGCYG